MTAHLSDSDRQALRLAHDLREELRRALPQVSSAPSVSPFVDPGGRPSVLMRMDADTAQALMAALGGHRAEPGGGTGPFPLPEDRRADGTVPPPGVSQGFAPHAPAPFQAVEPLAVPAGPPLLPTAFPGR